MALVPHTPDRPAPVHEADATTVVVVGVDASEGSWGLEFVHAKGDTAGELLRMAAALHADLIVVGRSSKVLHHLAGSLGRRLIRKRNAPVVVVP
jgi:nucleotide-binding universal stress UspA family protein